MNSARHAKSSPRAVRIPEKIPLIPATRPCTTSTEAADRPTSRPPKPLSMGVNVPCMVRASATRQRTSTPLGGPTQAQAMRSLRASQNSCCTGFGRARAQCGAQVGPARCLLSGRERCDPGHAAWIAHCLTSWASSVLSTRIGHRRRSVAAVLTLQSGVLRRQAVALRRAERVAPVLRARRERERHTSRYAVQTSALPARPRPGGPSRTRGSRHWSPRAPRAAAAPRAPRRPATAPSATAEAPACLLPRAPASHDRQRDAKSWLRRCEPCLRGLAHGVLRGACRRRLHLLAAAGLARRVGGGGGGR